MKAFVFIFLIPAVCYVECRKVVPIDKNTVTNFLNMEGGGSGGPNPQSQGLAKPSNLPAPKVPSSPTHLAPQPVQTKPAVTPAPATVKPVMPQPAQIQPRPVNPPPSVNPITTPGPGSVKQLITFYDSRGNASPIRPYSYSQAVKQG